MLYIVNSYSETWTRPKPPVTTKIQDQRYAYKRENSLKKSLIWIFCRFLKCSNKSVNSWTGFNIITKNINDLVVTKDAVGYVSTIGTPAISINNWHTCNKYEQWPWDSYGCQINLRCSATWVGNNCLWSGNICQSYWDFLEKSCSLQKHHHSNGSFSYHH